MGPRLFNTRRESRGFVTRFDGPELRHYQLTTVIGVLHLPLTAYASHGYLILVTTEENGA